jgi:6-phospho-beta-glucosidase
MAPVKVVVLGGGSPFMTTMFDEIFRSLEGSNCDSAEIVLYGVDQHALGLLVEYGRNRLGTLGWAVHGADTMAFALLGADVVVHQIRYGRLNGRAEDERFAESLGVPADETLGPAGLRSAIRMAPDLADTARMIAKSCPESIVINLTNPLSCSTAILAAASGCQTVGICELPLTTMHSACGILGMDPREVEWDYVGLNHRGFITRMETKSRDGISELAFRGADVENRLPGRITSHEIAELDAIPLKYFSLFTHPSVPRPSRAEQLASLRLSALAELEQDPHQPPNSVAKRDQPWYRFSLVPFLLSIVGSDSPAVSSHVVNVSGSGGITRECRANVDDGGIHPIEPLTPASSGVRDWMDRFETHERLVLAAANGPTPASIHAALSADPLIQDSSVELATSLLWSSLRVQ